MNRLEKAAQIAIFDALDLQPKQSLLLVAQPAHLQAAEIFRKVAEKSHLEVFLLEVPLRQPKLPLLSALSRNLLNVMESVVLLAPHIDSGSINWLRQQSRSRVIVWTHLEEDTIQRCATTDFHRLRERCRKLADILSIGRTLTLRLDNGTELEMSLQQRRGLIEATPLYNDQFCSSLPTGRAYITPQVSSINGEMLLHGIAGQRSFGTASTHIKVVDGKITLIKGDKASDVLRRRLRRAPETSDTGAGKAGSTRHVVEIGFGLNSNARLGQSELEDEKVLGTIHLGFGRRPGTNRPAEILARGIIVNPTVIIDGRELIRQGRLMFE